MQENLPVLPLHIHSAAKSFLRMAKNILRNVTVTFDFRLHRVVTFVCTVPFARIIGSPAHLVQDELCTSSSSSVHARGHPEDALTDELRTKIAE